MRTSIRAGLVLLLLLAHVPLLYPASPARRTAARSICRWSGGPNG